MDIPPPATYANTIHKTKLFDIKHARKNMSGIINMR